MLIINLFLILLIFFLLLILSMVWPPDSPWSPWWRISKKKAKVACRLAKVLSKDLVYELGSGDGTFLMVAVKEFKARGVGIEIEPFRWFISTLIIHISKVQDKVKVIRRNFFEVDLSEATIIFVYLVPRVILKLKPKFLEELKPDTKVISYVYQIDYLPLVKKDEENKIYVYKIPEKII